MVEDETTADSESPFDIITCLNEVLKSDEVSDSQTKVVTLSPVRLIVTFRKVEFSSLIIMQDATNIFRK